MEQNTENLINKLPQVNDKGIIETWIENIPEYLIEGITDAGEYKFLKNAFKKPPHIKPNITEDVNIFDDIERQIKLTDDTDPLIKEHDEKFLSQINTKKNNMNIEQYNSLHDQYTKDYNQFKNEIDRMDNFILKNQESLPSQPYLRKQQQLDLDNMIDAQNNRIQNFYDKNKNIIDYKNDEDYFMRQRIKNKKQKPLDKKQFENMFSPKNKLDLQEGNTNIVDNVIGIPKEDYYGRVIEEKDFIVPKTPQEALDKSRERFIVQKTQENNKKIKREYEAQLKKERLLEEQAFQQDIDPLTIKKQKMEIDPQLNDLIEAAKKDQETKETIKRVPDNKQPKSKRIQQLANDSKASGMSLVDSKKSSKDKNSDIFMRDVATENDIEEIINDKSKPVVKRQVNKNTYKPTKKTKQDIQMMDPILEENIGYTGDGPLLTNEQMFGREQINHKQKPDTLEDIQRKTNEYQFNRYNTDIQDKVQKLNKMNKDVAKDFQNKFGNRKFNKTNTPYKDFNKTYMQPVQKYFDNLIESLK